MSPERAKLKKMVEIFAVAFLVFLFTLILFPASTGISFGIRKKYVKVLRWMFEVRWGSSLGISSKNRASLISTDAVEFKNTKTHPGRT